MADESLGHIDINFPLGEYTGGNIPDVEGNVNKSIPDTAKVLRDIVDAFTKATNFNAGKSSVNQEGFSKPEFGKPSSSQPFSIEFLREILDNVKKINQNVEKLANVGTSSTPKIPTVKSAVTASTENIPEKSVSIISMPPVPKIPLPKTVAAAPSVSAITKPLSATAPSVAAITKPLAASTVTIPKPNISNPVAWNSYAAKLPKPPSFATQNLPVKMPKTPSVATEKALVVKPKDEEPKKESFLAKASSAYKHGKGLYSSITQSESLLGVASSAAKGVSSSVGGAGAMGAAVMLPLAAVTIGIAGTVAVVGITLKTIMSQTASVLERINHLAQVDGKMAMEQALNKLQQMQMDMKEAKILGPLYQQVSQLYRTIMTQLQPIMLVIKTIATVFLVWALETIISLLKLIREFTIYVVRGLATFFGGLAKGGMVATVGAALTANGKTTMATSPTGALISQFIGWTLTQSASELQRTSLKAYNALVKILAELEKANTPSSNSNEYFTTMLDALSIPTVDPFINATRGQKRATPANVRAVGSNP